MARFAPRFGIALSGALLGLVAFASAGEAMDIRRIDAPAGVEAWLVEDYTVPIISLDFAFAGGAAQDPDGKPGVANMLSSMLDEGAGDMKGDAFQAALEQKSIDVTFSAGRDSFFGDVRMLAEDREAATELLALALQKPRYDAESMARIRAAILENIKGDATDPQASATLAVCAKAFPNHPYGRPLTGTLASVASIAPVDLEAYRSRVFARDHLKVAIVGAVKPADAEAMLARLFGPLPEKAQLTPVADIVPAAGIIALDQPSPQTLIRFGGPGFERKDRDFMAGYVVNQIFGGGGFSSRLYKEVREKRGLAYQVSSTLVNLAHANAFAGGTAVAPDRADETMEIIHREMARFAAEGPTAEELAEAKSYMTASYAMRFSSSGKIAQQLVGIMNDGLGIDYVEKRNALITAVTLEDARRAARRLYGNGMEMVVTVGPARTKTADAAGMVPKL